MPILPTIVALPATGARSRWRPWGTTAGARPSRWTRSGEYKSEILTSNEPVFQYLENKYNLIESLFGFRKPVALNDIMAIYAGCRKKEDTESLKPLSDLCKKEFPNTMLGFYFEGEYYEQMGEPKKALRTFEKAFGMEEIDFLTKEMALEKMDALKADFGF
jgi:hypothetical protein